MTTTQDLLKRLEESVGPSTDVLLTCNAAKQDLRDVITLVKELERNLKVQQSLNKDYLCIISYKNLCLEGKLPEVPPYEHYQKRTDEFLTRSVNSKSPK